MAQNLDKIDLTLIYELDKDCRMPLTEIAKKTRKSPQYIKYRINRLKEEKIIQGVSILKDLSKDSFEVFCFIKLQGSSIVEEKLLIDALFKMPQTYRLYFTTGKYDIVASFIISDYKILEDIKENLIESFVNIDYLFLNILPFSQIHNKKYLIDSKEHFTFEINHKGRILDETDKKVLQELNRNPFGALLQISENINISYDKIKYLFKNLKPFQASRLILSDNLIKKSILLIDIKKNFEEIRKYLEVHKNVVQYDSILGEKNLAVFFESLGEEPSRVIKEFLYEFKDSIRDHEKIDIINTYKYKAVE